MSLHQVYLDIQAALEAAIKKLNLKPCPCCGEDNIGVEFEQRYTQIICTECGLSMEVYGRETDSDPITSDATTIEAARRWNKRTPCQV